MCDPCDTGDVSFVSRHDPWTNVFSKEHKRSAISEHLEMNQRPLDTEYFSIPKIAYQTLYEILFFWLLVN